MTSQKPWQRFTASNEVNVVGKFENEHGERFLIYRMKNGDTPYITGDEYDWQPRVNLLWNSFVYSDDEREKIARILWTTWSDITGANSNVAAGATASDAMRALKGLDLNWPADEE